jgi:hypothetical protein
MTCLNEVTRLGKCGKIVVKAGVQGPRGRGVSLEPLNPKVLEPFFLSTVLEP